MNDLIPESEQQYGSILTIAGENAEQNSKVLKTGVEITHIAFGDANDTYVQPNRNSQALVNEIHRIKVNSVDVQQATPDSVPMLKVEAILPPELSDLVIREFATVATFNGQTFFHAIGNCARIYVPKPVNNGNVPNPVTLEMLYVITSGEAIVEIDPRVVHASREWVVDGEKKQTDMLIANGGYLSGTLVELLGETSNNHAGIQINNYPEFDRNTLFYIQPKRVGKITDIDFTRQKITFFGGEKSELISIKAHLKANDDLRDITGLKLEGADETERFVFWMNRALNGENVQFPAGILRLGRRVVLTVNDSSPSISIDFNGMVISPTVDFVKSDVTNNIVEIKSDTGKMIPGSTINIDKWSFNNDTVPLIIVDDVNKRQGIGGLVVDGIESVNINDYRLKKSSYSSGLTVKQYKNVKIDGINLDDCGGKYKPTEDYVGVYDAAGDGIHLRRAQGKASVEINNAAAESVHAMGRAFLVSEDGIDAESIKIKVNNFDAENYQRIFHLEDGGKSTVVANGNAIRYANLIFQLGNTDNIHELTGRYEYISDGGGNFAYGGVSGMLNIPQNKDSGDAIFKSSTLLYSSGCAEKGSTVLDNSVLRIGSAISILKVGSQDVHINSHVVFATNLGTQIHYQHGGTLNKIGGTSRCPDPHIDAYRFLGAGMKTSGGYESINAFPYIEGGGVNPVAGYNDSQWYASAGGTYFYGEQARRKFNNVRIETADDQFFKLAANAGAPFNQLDNTKLINGIIEFNMHRDANRLVSKNLTQEFTTRCPAENAITQTASQLAFVGYVMDMKNTLTAPPSTAEVGIFRSSIVIKKDGSITDI